MSEPRCQHCGSPTSLPHRACPSCAWIAAHPSYESCPWDDEARKLEVRGDARRVPSTFDQSLIVYHGANAP